MISKLKLCVFAGLMALLFVSCAKEDVATSTAPNVIAKVIDGNLEMQMEFEEAAMYFATDFESTDDILEWGLESYGAYYYLVARGPEPGTGNWLSVAVELDRNGDELTLDPVVTTTTTQQAGNLQAAKVKHKCSSTSCGCCGFLTDNQGQIYGCKCRAPIGNCNNGGTCGHSIETVQVVVGN